MAEAHSGLKPALDLTSRTIAHRARNYRNLVVGVVGVSLGSALWALLQLSWVPLMGILLVAPLILLFLLFDGFLMTRWKKAVLDFWQQGALDLMLFSQTAFSIRSLPTRTLKSMLEAFAFGNRIGSPADLDKSVQESIRRVIATMDRCEMERTVAVGVSISCACGAVVLAWVLRDWRAMAIALFAAFVLALSFWVRIYRFTKLQHHFRRLKLLSKADRLQFIDVLDCLDWGGFPVRFKKGLINALLDAPGFATDPDRKTK